MPANKATKHWAAWACERPESCPQDHCARCGEHVGGQGHLSTGFWFDGGWHRIRAANAPYECDEETSSVAIRNEYDEPFARDAIAYLRKKGQFKPDRRAK